MVVSAMKNFVSFHRGPSVITAHSREKSRFQGSYVCYSSWISNFNASRLVNQKRTFQKQNKMVLDTLTSCYASYSGLEESRKYFSKSTSLKILATSENNTSENSVSTDPILKTLAKDECTGCGYKMQSQYPDQLGYIPPLLNDLKEKGCGTRRNLASLFEKYPDFDSSAIDESLIRLPPKRNLPPVRNETEEERLIREKKENDRELRKLENLAKQDEKISISIEESIRKRNQSRDLICQRCFMLKHYGKVYPVKVPMEHFRKKLSILRTAPNVMTIFLVIDIFDFYGSFISDLHEIIGVQHEVFVIANKIDLLPKNFSEERIRLWIRKMAIAQKVYVRWVYLVSSRDGFGMGELLKRFEHFPKGREIFVIGTSNSGKSTFINYLIDKRDIASKLKTTTSRLPGTTLNVISVPIERDITLFDTPGILNPNQAINMLTIAELRFLLPVRRVRPIVYSLNPGNSIFIGGLLRIDYLSGPNGIYFTVFASNQLPLHVRRTRGAELFYQRNIGRLLYPPSSEEERKKYGKGPFPAMVPANEWHLEGNSWREAHSDIAFSGIGWISITGIGKVHIRVFAPEGINISLRDAVMMPFETPSRLAKDVIPIRKR